MDFKPTLPNPIMVSNRINQTVNGISNGAPTRNGSLPPFDRRITRPMAARRKEPPSSGLLTDWVHRYPASTLVGGFLVGGIVGWLVSRRK